MEKEINIQIIKLLFEIFLISIFVVFTYFLWGELKINQYTVINSYKDYSSSLNISEEKPIFNSLLIPMSDNDAISNLQSGILKISNKDNLDRKYTLIIQIDKSSTLDYRTLILAIDDNIYKLKDLEYSEDDRYYYILLINDVIKNYKEYETKIWLSHDTTNEAMNKTLTLSFNIIETNPQVAMN